MFNVSSWFDLKAFCPRLTGLSDKVILILQHRQKLAIRFFAVPPSLVTTPVNQTIMEGTTATFHCTATGNPVPKITWTMNGKTVGSGKTLSFETNRNQSGKYWCSASNGLDVIVNASANLDVLCKWTAALWEQHCTNSVPEEAKYLYNSLLLRVELNKSCTVLYYDDDKARVHIAYCKTKWMVTGTQNCQKIFSQVAHETSSLNKKIVRPARKTRLFELCIWLVQSGVRVPWFNPKVKKGKTKLEFQLNLFKAHGKSGHIHICYRVLTFNFAFYVQINQVWPPLRQTRPPLRVPQRLSVVRLMEIQPQG